MENQNREKTFLGHPAGLYVLFTTEMWERFSFYGMQAIFIYYMTNYLQYKQALASEVFGLYIGFAYFTPFFGGLLADKVLGQRKTVILGAILMCIGHFLMAFEAFLYPALITLVLGNGALKPNISTQVSGLYPEDDPRLDRAFSIFYLGINVGAFLSPLVCGTLGEKLGFHYGFAAAGVGMLIALGVYLKGQKYLAPDQMMKTGRSGGIKQPLTQDEKKRIWVLVVLCFLNIFFWAVYEQQGNTIALWAQDNTDRMLFGGKFEIPASWFQSVNPFIMFFMTPLLIQMWGWQNKRRKEPSSISKMGIGCILLGLAFIPMAFAARISTENSNAGYLLSCLFLMTVGELYLSPIGLSFVTKIAPARMVSMLMGVWFLASFAGNYLSGVIGTLWEQIPKTDFFTLCAALSIGTGIVILLLKKPFRRIEEKSPQSVAIGTDAAFVPANA